MIQNLFTVEDTNGRTIRMKFTGHDCNLKMHESSMITAKQTVWIAPKWSDEDYIISCFGRRIQGNRCG
ncbi:MAG: hypothetical protein DMF68_00275 [Acidobacteria bacterium]|nr:MAG: hypothetical protein DMF68_00275 [Acidobacteriota bacterium]